MRVGGGITLKQRGGGGGGGGIWMSQAIASAEFSTLLEYDFHILTFLYHSISTLVNRKLVNIIELMSTNQLLTLTWLAVSLQQHENPGQ